MFTVRRGDIVRMWVSHEAVPGGPDEWSTRWSMAADGAAMKEENAELISALPSDRMPDPRYAVRRDLQAEGAVLSVMGSTVETVHRPDASAPVRSEVRAGMQAARLQVSVSFV